MKPKITVIGIGPGNAGDMTAYAIEALRQADIIVGYKYYIPFISNLIKPDATIVQNGMKQEQTRIEKAFEIAESGKDVCYQLRRCRNIWHGASYIRNAS